MATPRVASTGAAQIVWTLVLALALGGVLGQSDTLLVPAAVIAGGALLVFGVVSPALFVGIFLLLRPLLDDYGGQSSGSGVNVGGALGLLVIVVAIAYALTAKRLVLPRATFPALLLLALSCVFAALAVANFHSALGLRPLSEIIRLCAMFAMYFLAVNAFDTIAGAKRVMILVALSALLPAIEGVIQWIGGAPVKQNVDLGRISGPFVGPNPFGTYLAFGALVLIALPRDYLPKTLRLAGIAVMVGALVGTYSRVGYILFLGGVLVLGWRVRRAAAVTAVLGAVIIVLTVPTVHDRVLPKNAPTSSQEQTYESFSWRLENWKGLLRQWEHSPVVGYGIETVPFVNPRVLTDSNGNTSRFGGGFDAHNLAIKSLVEGGPVLLLSWIAMIGSLIGLSVRLARDAWPLKHFGFLVAVLWSLTAFISVSTGEPTGETAFMFSMLAATGALEGAHRSWRIKQREQFPLGPVWRPLYPAPVEPEKVAPA